MFYFLIENSVVPQSRIRHSEPLHSSNYGTKPCYHTTGGDSDDDRDDGVVRGVEGDRRHHLVVALLEHQESAVVLIRLVIAVHDLVTPLRHAAHADHVSAQCH